MDMYTTGTVQVLYPLDRPYTPYRSDEDAYYEANAGLQLPHWFAGIIHVLGCLGRHGDAAHSAPIRTTQTA